MNTNISVSLDDILVRPFIDPEGKFRGYIAGLALDFPYERERELPETIPQTPGDALKEFVDVNWPELRGLAVGRAWQKATSSCNQKQEFDDLEEAIRAACPELAPDRVCELAKRCERTGPHR